VFTDLGLSREDVDAVVAVFARFRSGHGDF
jgi:uncharacterized protein YjiS (DUF1127 family)